MKGNIIALPEIKLVGFTVRTKNEIEMDPKTRKVGPAIQKFFDADMQSKIPDRKNPGRLFGVYTKYAVDSSQYYTYFFGEEICALPASGYVSGFEIITVPAQTYARFTSAPGEIPHVISDTWQQIWKMTPEAMGGERSYIADLELYDERSADPQNAVVDIYVGIKQS